MISVFVKYMNKASGISCILIPLADFPSAQRLNLIEGESRY